tara:strand:+ start:2644 stop:4191 length:1548 start_codon:yes stop_codon:yes gene_type:complete
MDKTKELLKEKANILESDKNEIMSMFSKCSVITFGKTSKIKFIILVILFFYMYSIFTYTMNEKLCRLSNLLCKKNMFSLTSKDACNNDPCSYLSSSSLSNLVTNGKMINVFNIKNDTINEFEKINCQNDITTNIYYTEKEKHDIVKLHTKLMNLQRLNSLSYSCMKYLVSVSIIYKIMNAMFIEDFNKNPFLKPIKNIFLFGSGIILIYSTILETYILNITNLHVNKKLTALSEKIIDENKSVSDNILIYQDKKYLSEHITTTKSIMYTKMVIFIVIVMTIVTIRVHSKKVPKDFINSLDPSNRLKEFMNKKLSCSTNFDKLIALFSITGSFIFIYPILDVIYSVNEYAKEKFDLSNKEDCNKEPIDRLKNIIKQRRLGVYGLPVNMIIKAGSNDSPMWGNDVPFVKNINYKNIEIVFLCATIISILFAIVNTQLKNRKNPHIVLGICLLLSFTIVGYGDSFISYNEPDPAEPQDPIFFNKDGIRNKEGAFLLSLFVMIIIYYMFFRIIKLKNKN